MSAVESEDPSPPVMEDAETDMPDWGLDGEVPEVPVEAVDPVAPAVLPLGSFPFVSGAMESTASLGIDCPCMDAEVSEETPPPRPSDGFAGGVASAALAEPPSWPEDPLFPFDWEFLYRLPKAETVAPARGKPEPARAAPATPSTPSGVVPSEDSVWEPEPPSDEVVSACFSDDVLDCDPPVPPVTFASCRSSDGEPWLDIGLAPERADLSLPDAPDLPPCSPAFEARPESPAAPWMPRPAAAPASEAAVPTVAAPAAPARIRPTEPGMKSAICLIRVKGKMEESIMPTTAMRVVVVEEDMTMSLHVTQMHSAITGCMRMMPTIQPAHFDTSGLMVLQPWSMSGMAAMTMAKIRRKLRAAIIRSRTKLPSTTQTQSAIVINPLSNTSKDALSIPGMLPPSEPVLRMLFVRVSAKAVPLTARVMHSTVNGHARAVRAPAESTPPMSCVAAARRMP